MRGSQLVVHASARMIYGEYQRMRRDVDLVEADIEIFLSCTRLFLRTVSLC